MSYQAWNKKDLISEIERLKRLNEVLLDEKDQEIKLDYAWAGHLGNWYWDYVTNVVTFNDLKVMALGFQIDEVPSPIGFEFFTERIHKDDYDYVMQNMRDHLYGKINAYDVEYRIQAKDGSYKYYHDLGKVTKRDSNGKPLFLAGIVFDITERRLALQELERMNKILEKQSSTDSLTKLLNHRALYDKLNEIQRSKHDNNAILSMMDLDDFKNINDTYGHLVGDEVLSDTAKILEKHAKNPDFVGRYGGEEFLMVMIGKTKEECNILLENIRKEIVDHFKKKNLEITISIGYTIKQKESINEWIKRADQALYHANKNGKNRVVEGI
jgi:diguanylate cyclase (GGDEF)-like protein/PAS domain S-box-containing protein